MFEMVEVDLPVADTLISHFVVSSEVQVLVTTDRRICVSDIGRGKFFTYEIPGKADDEVKFCFLCPGGVHCLLCTVRGENYYINCKEEPTAKNATGKARRCDKLRGIEISAVGWNKHSPSNADYEKNSGAVLLGTATGQLLEARLEKDGGAKSFRTAYDLKERAGESGAVLGLEVERFPLVPGKASRWVVVATTVCRIYQFVGGPLLETIFDDEQYKRSPPFQELPSVAEQSALCVWHKNLRARTFAWLTGVGVMHGRFVFPKPVSPNGPDAGRESILQDHNIIPNFDQVPRSIAISEFHFYLLYADQLLVLGHPPGMAWTSSTEPCEKLKQQDIRARVDFKFTFDVSRPSQHGLGLTRDAATGLIYAYTPSAIYELAATHEDKNVWRQFLDRAQAPNEREPEMYFRRALKHCGDDTTKRERVLLCKAEHYFSRQNFVEAARVWSMSSCRFEEVALRLMAVHQHEALLQFALHRLLFIRRRRGTNQQQESSQLTCLTTWVVQMFLDQMNRLAEANSATPAAQSPKMAALQADFRQFLRDNLDVVDKPTVHVLIGTDGQPEENRFFCELVGDYERLMTIYLTDGHDSAAAVRVLTKHCLEEQYASVWYQFSPSLMELYPDELVRGWMSEGPSRFLQPTKLMPALVKYDPARHNPPHVKEDQAILYLNWLVTTHHNKDPALHNLLVSLYARQGDEAPLLAFLSASAHYDEAFALRLCLAQGKVQSSAHLYARLGLYEDAVALALRVGDVRLAKAYAQQPGDEDAPLRRKLWLRLAEYTIRQRGDLKAAIDLLKQTRDIKLEDVLPFFPDFVLIKDFKREIISSLEAYTQDIEHLKAEMEEATRNADVVRASIRELRHRYGYVTATQPCDVCGRAALGGDFYLFPSCRHVFHQPCLLELIRDHLPAPTLSRIHVLQKVLAEGEQAVKKDDSDGSSRLADAQREFEALVAHECPYCSEFMISTLDQSFTPSEQLAASWAL
eukprot:GGOE01017947.1.p1 GENE.GGOE01017947.1~~GGOE01017947.1.p1  ORF type:complete len:1032 (-),score=229.87 GGOE01017947.1:26-2953(-)